MNPDPLLRMVERLPRVEPDATRAERVRARCHAELARRQRRRAPKRTTTMRMWETALVGGLCLAYFTEVVRHALQLYGAF